MDEKIPYKARNPGGGRKKLKPEYNAGKNLKEQMDAAVTRYKDGMTLQSIADALSLNPIKVRKLLITAGIYESDIAKMVQHTFNNYKESQSYKDAVLSTASALKLSRASVTSYLPYEKGVYFPKEAPVEKISVGAERQRRYRAVRKLRTEPTEEHLWESVIANCSISNKYHLLPPYPSKKRPVKFQSKYRWEKAARTTNNLLHSQLVSAHPHKIHPDITPQSRKITD